MLQLIMFDVLPCSQYYLVQCYNWGHALSIVLFLRTQHLLQVIDSVKKSKVNIYAQGEMEKSTHLGDAEMCRLSNIAYS